MKIHCDVCDKDEASVFCVADEAALCNSCDHRVHHANKLAGKHQRFSLIHPSSAKQIPLCDICQERRAFLFCQEDRAILCRECDIPIHKVNEHTQKHNRFLLTGVKLSLNSSLYSSSSPSPAAAAASSANSLNDGVPNIVVIQPQNQRNNSSTMSKAPTTTNGISINGGQLMTNGGGGGTGNVPTSSSISEYLIEMLPGWHVEDFLDPSSSPNYGFCKSSGENIWDGDLESNLSSYSSPESNGGAYCWVPQVAAMATPPSNEQIQSFSTSSNMGFGGQIMNFKDNSKSSRKWIKEDNSFAVPQINNPPPNSIAGSKRHRTLW